MDRRVALLLGFALLAVAGCATPPPTAAGPQAAQPRGVLHFEPWDAFNEWQRHPCDPDASSQPNRGVRILPRFQDAPEVQVARLRDILEPGATLTPDAGAADRGAPEDTWRTPRGSYSAQPYTIPGTSAWRITYEGADMWDATATRAILEGFLRAWEIPESQWLGLRAEMDGDGHGSAAFEQPGVRSSYWTEAKAYLTYEWRREGSEMVRSGTRDHLASEVTLWPALETPTPPAVPVEQARAIAAQSAACLLGASAPDFTTQLHQIVGMSTGIQFAFAEPVPDPARPECVLRSVTIDDVSGAVLRLDHVTPYGYYGPCPLT